MMLVLKSRSLLLTAFVILASHVAFAANDPTVDPCTLVTKAEAEQIIGKVKNTPVSSRVERVTICEFTFVDEKNALELWIFPAEGLDRAKKLIKDLSPVSGLGQEAFMTRNKDIPYMELYTKKGDVTLKVMMKETPGVEEKVKLLAKKALSRL